MTTRQQVLASVVAIGLGLGASYALAEQSPAAHKKPAEDKSAAAGSGHSCEGEHGGKSCCNHHEGMHGDHAGKHGDHECKHGDHECKHGDHECKHGGKDGAMSCPMMRMDRPALDAKVENTSTGAVIRLTAKNPADAAKVQKMATMIAAHLSAAPSVAPPADKGPALKH